MCRLRRASQYVILQTPAADLAAYSMCLKKKKKKIDMHVSVVTAAKEGVSELFDHRKLFKESRDIKKNILIYSFDAIYLRLNVNNVTHAGRFFVCRVVAATPAPPDAPEQSGWRGLGGRDRWGPNPACSPLLR